MVYWDDGVLLVDLLPRSKMIYAAHYWNALDKEKLSQPTGQHGSFFMLSCFKTMLNHPRWSNSGLSSTDCKCCSIH
jgi:hypothetical protein